MKHRGLLSLLLIAVFILSIQKGHAQYYTTGADPAYVKWNQLQTNHFNFIYPAVFQTRIGELAGYFEAVYAHDSHSLDHKPKPISVIIHSYTATSNGMVAWAPKRIELFMNPNQTIYAEPWDMQLATHEFRHVVQMDKLSSDLPFVLKLLFGEQVTAAAVGLYLPYWFLEGDAVSTETVFSGTGRGRQPSFLMIEKAQILSKGLYSYDKAVLGSYKDYVPNRYSLGYRMVGGIRARYGTNVWSDVLTEIGRKPFSINPLNRVLKEKTGYTKEQLYQKILMDYRKEWQHDLDTLELSSQKIISPPLSNYTNYKYTIALPDSNVIALKTSRPDIDRIVRIKNGKEKVIYTPGNIVDGSFTQTNDWLVWVEKYSDIRWDNAVRTRIVCWNFKSGEKKIIKTKEDLAAPVLNSSETSLAAVSRDFQNNFTIAVFDFKTGKLRHQFHTSNNVYFISPCWLSDSVLYFVGLVPKGKYIGNLDVESGRFSVCTKPTTADIRSLIINKNKLYYTSSYSGIDNIYSMNLDDLSDTRQLTSVCFGADYASIINNQLYFSNYTANGFEICKMDLDSAIDKSINVDKHQNYELADQLVKTEKDTFRLQQPLTIDTSSTKPYSKLAHLFHFHSWAPAYINTDNYEITPGISFLSQNELGTAETTLGYDYDLSEHTGKYHANFKYTGWWPVLDAELSYGNRKRYYLTLFSQTDPNGQIISQYTQSVLYQWHELKASLDAYVPLTFAGGKYSQYMQTRIKYNYTGINQNKSNPGELYDGFYHSLHYQFYFQNKIRSAELDFVPDWEQTLQIDYKTSLSGGRDLGNIAGAQSYLYFPGLGVNQAFRIYNGFQKVTTGESTYFSNVVRMARGYSSYENKQLYTFGFDYFFPLAYPDWNLGRLYYLNRLRANAFYDYSSLTSEVSSTDGSIASQYTYNQQSMGIQLIAEGYLFRLPAPTTIGIRGIYRKSSNDFAVEAYFSIAFDSF